MSSPSPSKTLDDFPAPPLETSYNSPPSQLLTLQAASPSLAFPVQPSLMSPPPALPSLTFPVVSPPPTSTSTTKGMSAGVRAGVVVILVVVLVGVFIYFYEKRKRKAVQERLRMENNNGHSHAPPQDSSTNSRMDLESTERPVPQPSPGSMDPESTERPVPQPSPGSMDPESTERPVPPPSPGSMALGYSLRKFSCEELKRATDSFSKANHLGGGGFGNVYKGVLPVPDEKVIAVKQLKSGSDQGEREFLTEVEVISRVHHRNLVSLVGYCIDGDQRMLVYDFVPNKTLGFHLHGNEGEPMDWPKRMKIALGSAEGLAYLHEGCQPKIIHRDIKPTNILLDDNFEAKVADFGLAKSLLETDTHVSTRGKGTYGYMDMEYANSEQLTEKSDVFSFGVVLLELITGQKPCGETLVEWARPLLEKALENKNFDELVDPRLQNVYNPEEMTQMVGCAAACVRGSAQVRPQMSEIIQALKGNICFIKQKKRKEIFL